jgi:hypothetical protein
MRPVTYSDHRWDWSPATRRLCASPLMFLQVRGAKTAQFLKNTILVTLRDVTGLGWWYG